MAENRVDTTRPEYSWIPFFEDLARRLHEDGWRERQGEIVAELKRHHLAGVGLNDYVQEMDTRIDPFSIYALMCTNLGWPRRSRIFATYKEMFGIDSEIPVELPTVPVLFQNILFFAGNTEYTDDVETHWDSFETLLGLDGTALALTLADVKDNLTKSLRARTVQMSKWSMALFWVSPNEFAHVNTLRSALAQVGSAEVEYPRTAEQYFDMLIQLRGLDPRPIPEINLSEYVADQFRKNPQSKRIWRILAWADHSGVSEFLESSSAKVHFGIHEIDFSEFDGGEELKDRLRTDHPDWSEVRLTQLVNFGFGARRGDVVVMPTGEADRVHVGFLTSNQTFMRAYGDNPRPINHRSVAWRHELDIPGIPQRSGTFVEVDKAADEVRRLLSQAEGPAIDDEGGGEDPSTGSDESKPIEWPSDEIFLKDEEQVRMLDLLWRKKNLILQGPPGTGKTFIAKRLAYALMGERADDRIASVQFHQSYSYEDFVGGYRPSTNHAEQLVFKPEDGAFLRLCDDARKDPDNEYVMLIDEINRGNLSRVFGELLMLIESDKRNPESAVVLQHLKARGGDGKFHVPPNVYIIGTMNLADRSLTGMNVAMRRRFAFVELEPRFDSERFGESIARTGQLGRIRRGMEALNTAIADDPSLGPQYKIGHSYFCPEPDHNPPNGNWDEWFKMVVKHEIRPLLNEYWFDQLDTAQEEADKLLCDE